MEIAGEIKGTGSPSLSKGENKSSPPPFPKWKTNRGRLKLLLPLSKVISPSLGYLYRVNSPYFLGKNYFFSFF
jgi:hypothetical protein